MRFPQAQLEDTRGQIAVGGIYFSVDPTDPAITLGYGTWEAFGQGRALVGVDPLDPDFDAAEKTAGSKTVTLTEAQIPAHTHVQDAHGHAVTDPGHVHVENSNNTTTGGLRGWGAPDTSTNNSTATDYSTASAQTGVTVNNATAVNQNTGGGQAHSNVQPSITVHIFKRVA